MSKRKCAVSTCVNLAQTRGWCKSHYGRWLRTDDVRADEPLQPSGKARTGTSLESRFWAKADKRGPDECWPWKAPRPNKGYATIGMKLPDGRWVTAFAFRVAYELAYGPVPDGLQVDHICHNNDPDCPGGDICEHRGCVNPAHLEAVPGKINTQRAHHRKTCCKYGHEFTPENTYYRANGGRRCRTCALGERHALYQERWRQGLTAQGHERLLPPRDLVARALEAGDGDGSVFRRQPSEIPQRRRRNGPQEAA